MSEQKDLSYWLNKLKVFWALHGGIKEWDSVRAVDVCSFCGRRGFSNCQEGKILRVRPDLSEIYEEEKGQLRHMNTWCAEWIKYV